MATKTEHDLLIAKLRNKYKEKPQEQVVEDDDNWFQKWIKASSRFQGNLQKGLYKSFEGLLDFGTSIVGSGLDLVGLDEASKSVHEFGGRDLTQEFLESDFNKYSTYFTAGGLTSGLDVNEWAETTYGEQQYLPDIVENLSVGAGNLLGMIAGSKGLGTLGKAGKWGSIIGMSGGQSYEQALQEGAEGLEATGYGIASGITEAVSEAIVGKVLGKLGLGTGKVLGVGDGVSGVSSAKTPLGTAVINTLKNFTEEGAEEVFSDLVNPLLKKATYKNDSSLQELYGDQTFEDYVETFIVGGILGGVSSVATTASGAKAYGSLEAYNLSQEVEAIADVNEQLEKALKKGDSQKYNELLAKKDLISEKINTKYEKFLKDVNKGKIKMETLRAEIDKITNQLESGKINPDDIARVRRQQLAREVRYETIKDVRATVAKELLDTTFDGKVKIDITTEKGVKGNYNASTNTLTINPNNLDINNFVETLLHETFHGLANQQFIDEMLKTFGSQEAYQQAYDKIYETYSKNKKTSKAIANLTEDQKKAYIDEEISANIFGATFQNVNQYLRAIKKMDSKGISRLIANIKTLFDGRSKPKNYREILRHLEERRTALNNSEVKPETTKTTKTTTKYSLDENTITEETEYSLDEDSEGVQLSNQQVEYFKETLAKDEEGRLLRLYHGSNKAGFMQFSNEKGIYFFTPDYEVASTYARSSELVVTKTFKTADELIDWWYDGGADELGKSNVDVLPKKEAQDIIDDYFNFLEEYYPEERKFIEFKRKALESSDYVVYDGTPTFYTKEQLLEDFLSDIQTETNLSYEEYEEDQGYADEEDEKELKRLYGESKNVYSVYLNIKKPLIIDCKGRNFTDIRFRGELMTTDEISELIKQEGKYDGIIFRNIVDNGYRDPFNDLSTGDVYVAFNSNQIKATDNLNPTEKPDIRYSLDETTTKKTPEQNRKQVSNFVETLKMLSYKTSGIETKFKITADIKKILVSEDLEKLARLEEEYGSGNTSIKESLETLQEFLVENNLTKKELAEQGYKYLSKWNELYNSLLSIRKSIINEKSLSLEKTNSKFERVRIINDLISDVYKMINTVYNDGIIYKTKIKREEKEFNLALKGNENKEFSNKMESIINSLTNTNKNISKNTEEDYQKQLELAKKREEELQKKREERTLTEEEKESLKKKQEEEARKSAEEFNKRIKEEELRKKQEEEAKAKVITPNKIKKGVRIKHSTYGLGTVNSVENGFVKIDFDNSEVGQKSMNLEFLLKNNKLELSTEEAQETKTVIVEGQEFKKQFKNKYAYITVAPYYDTQLTNENFERIKSQVDEKFKQAFDIFAKKLEVKYDEVYTNIGGFTFSEGENAGKVVKELSYTFILDEKTDMQKADLLASLMGDLGYEQQEAVISARYLNKEEYSQANAVEYNISVKEINEKVYDTLSKHGINDFTINLEEKTIKILDFVEGYDENKVYEAKEKIFSFIEDLGGNHNELQIQPIQSNYIDKSYRKSVYEQSTKRYKDNVGQGEINSYIAEAQKRLEQETTQEQVQEEIKKETEQTQTVEEKPKKKKIVKTTEQNIEELSKTIKEDSYIYIATKKISPEDNAKTLKLLGDVRSDKVYNLEDAVEITEKVKKYLQKKDMSIVFKGKGYRMVQHGILEVLNNAYEMRTESEIKQEIYEIIESYLAKNVELSTNEKKHIKRIIREVVENNGKESKIHKAKRVDTEKMMKEINKLYDELKETKLSEEALEANIKELNDQLKELKKNKLATDKAYEKLIKKAEKLEEQLKKSKGLNKTLTRIFNERITEVKKSLNEQIKSLKKELRTTEVKLRRETKKVEAREDKIDKVKYYNKLKDNVDTLSKEIKRGRLSTNITPIIETFIEKFNNISTRTEKALREFIPSIKIKLEALVKSGEIDFIMEDDFEEAFTIVSNASGNINSDEMWAYNYILKRLQKIAQENYKERVIKHETFTTPNGTKYVEGRINELREEAISKKDNLKDKFGKKAKANTLKTIMNISSPRVLFKFLDGYNENGINTKMFNALRKAETRKQKDIMILLEPIANFFKKNKSFAKTLNKKVELKGIKATNGELLTIYKLLVQKDSYEHIILNGFEVQKVEYKNFDTDEKLDGLKRAIEQHFNLGTNSVADKYLKEITKMFELAKEWKIETDEKIFGFSELSKNSIDEYFPIQVSQEYKKQIRPDNFIASLMGAKNLSFNKGRTGSKGKLIIADIDYIVNNYVRGMAFYHSSAETVRDFNSLYSGFVGDKTVLAHMNEIFKNTKNESFVSESIAKMINDYQGIRKPPSIFESWRSKIATYYLGLNIKVMAGQVSSYFSANTYLDVFNPKVVALSFDKRLGEIPKPDYMKFRTFDSVVIKSEALSDTLSQLAQKTTKGIQFMDSLVIERLWRIALAQNNVLEKGISQEERNRRIEKATEQCELAIRETQDNYSVTERSAFARSENVIAKLLNQFRSSQNQYWSMLVDSTMAIYTKSKLGQKVTKEDLSKLSRSTTGILAQGLVYTAIALLMKRLLNRDDKELDFTQWFNQFFNDSILGVIPAISNVVNFEFDFSKDAEKLINVNYQDLEVSPLNLMIGALTDISNAIGNVKDQKIGGALSKFLISFGKFTGLPTENVLKLSKTALVTMTGETGYKIENWLNGTEIETKSKINSAINANKTTKAETYYEIYTKGIMDLDDDVIKLMFDLYKDGYDNSYLKTIPDYFIVDEEQINVDKQVFMSKYGKLSTALTKIKNNANFKRLSDEEKEMCISKLVNGYYTLAKNTILEKDLTSIHILMDADYNLSEEMVHLVKISQIESTKTQTKKEQVENYLKSLRIDINQKLLISFLAGYKLSDKNIVSVKRYLSSKGLPLKVVKKLFEKYEQTKNKNKSYKDLIYK